MSQRVNRPYRAPQRTAAAARTRQRIIQAARDLFVHQGWNGTTVAEIARRADVSVDTVYASVGRKPAVVCAVVDDVLGEGRGPVPAAQRQYVIDVGAAQSAAEKIATYAMALGRLMPKVAPLLLSLRDAAAADAGCAQAWQDIVERRARNMLLFAADLRETGDLREELTDQDVADVVWATNSPEYYTLLSSRGWSSPQYVAHLSDLWQRLLLAG
jgi:AcrR family transcriptional regulator